MAVEMLTYRLKKEGLQHVIVAVIREGDKQYVSYSRCSNGDQFNRKIGRQIALGRLHCFIHGDVHREKNNDKIKVLPFPCEEKVVFKAIDRIGIENIIVPAWMLTPPKPKTKK